MSDVKKPSLLLILLSSIFVVFSVVLLVLMLFKGNHSTVYNIAIVTDIVASVFGLVYLNKGYSKGAAKYYKTFMIIFMVNAIAVGKISTGESIAYIPLIMCVIVLGISAFLTFGKDMGKKVSYICCAVIVLIRLFGMISIVTNETASPDFNEKLALIISQLALAIMAFVMTYAKYIDKENRGTK